MHILVNKGDILSVSVKLKLCTMFVLLTKHNLKGFSLFVPEYYT